MKNKAKIISIISVVLILIIGIAGYFMYQKSEEEKSIKENLNNITKIETSFSKAETHEEKLNILKSCITEMTDYNKSKEHFEQVTDKYKSTISSMQEVFAKEYDSIIEENTLSNLDSLEDVSTITNNKNNLSSLLSTIDAEKDYVFSSNDDFESYQQKITELTESYTNRITALEEAKKKAEEEAKRKAEEEAKRKAEEEKAKTHYENEYFSVDVPKEWIDCWSVQEEKRGTDGTIYHFSYDPPGENNGGGGRIFVVDATYGLPQNGLVISEPCDIVGYTSHKFAVFKGIEAGAGFFFDGGATITLK
ncbi:MAG: hypothetical protein KHW68_08960 [Lachnospiraceae bacterium]|nr:hypothetical protein [Lachnospiraceae bacterium]